jgi:hypothetical protein
VKDLATFRRGAFLFCLALAPVLMLISVSLQPPFVEGYADRLADVDQAGASAWVSSALFIATQPPMLVVYLGIAHLLRHHTPRLAVASCILGFLATFGEAVMGGTALVYLTMASQGDNREVFAGIWEQMESSPVMVLALLGFGGTVLTLILLSVGLFRSRIVPRWVPALVWAFFLLEFFGSALTPYASYAAVVCLMVVFAVIARHALQTPTSDWAAGAGDRDEVAAAA